MFTLFKNHQDDDVIKLRRGFIHKQASLFLLALSFTFSTNSTQFGCNRETDWLCFKIFLCVEEKCRKGEKVAKNVIRKLASNYNENWKQLN